MSRPIVIVAVAVTTLAASVAPRAARAHDPFEITADARVAGDCLAVHLTMSRATATIACGARTALERCAADFLRVTAAGQPLTLRDVRVAPGLEEDVEMHVTWARPAGAAARGPLAFTAPRLARLDDPDAGVVLTVTGERTVLGQGVLRRDHPRLEVLPERALRAPSGSRRASRRIPRA